MIHSGRPGTLVLVLEQKLKLISDVKICDLDLFIAALLKITCPLNMHNLGMIKLIMPDKQYIMTFSRTLLPS